jgi:HlyD family secretion protein
MVLEKKDSVMVIPEALLQFDKKTDKPYVEIAVGAVADQKFERKDVEIGISDGVNVEIVSGITKEDDVKIWNKTEPIKKGDEDEEDDNKENASEE